MSNTKTVKTWDVIVIGGGPAGMMAAGRAAERGKKVLLLEKNPSLGKKLLITGGGRCNLTNNKLETKALVSSYKTAPRELFSVFSQFRVEETLEFFHSRGMKTKVEAEGRVFPVSNKAESVWQVMVGYLETAGVKVRTKATVTSISIDKSNKDIKVETIHGTETTKSCILATGGASRPETGSTGDGFKWLSNLNHTIVENSFALVPIALKNDWVKKLAGITLSDIRLNILLDGLKQESGKGKMLFTHFGISGPTVLNMSSKVGELMEYGEVVITLDLFPHLDHGELKLQIHDLLTTDSNKKVKNNLTQLIPSALVKVILELIKIDPDKPSHSVTKQERLKILQQLKSMSLNPKGLLGADKAVVSSGGVRTDQVDFKTMESKIVPGLYVTGDVLNIDRPSGGYSLQLCWATGFVAGDKC